MQAIGVSILYINSETRNQKQETRNKKQETRNQKQETRNQKQETRNKKQEYFTDEISPQPYQNQYKNRPGVSAIALLYVLF